MTEATKKMKEEADLTNEILYGKKNSKKTEKKESSPLVEKLTNDDEDLEVEILTGKTVKPAKISKLSKEDQEDVDLITDLLGGKKKKKAEPSEDGKEEKKPGKKFNREEYFGL
jgi:hypothetical protein